MRSGRLQFGMMLGVVLLLISGAEAQEAIPLPQPKEEPLPLIDGKHPVAEPLVPSTETHGVDGPAWHESHPAPETAATSLAFWGDYLFLKARRNSLDVAVQGNAGAAVTVGNVQALDWQTQSGFRLGAGFQRPGSEWQVDLSYTYFHTHDRRGFFPPLGGSLFATLPRAGGVDQVNTVQGDTNLNYQVVDLELSRRFHFSEDFDLRLFGGGRYAQIEQALNVLYNGFGATNYLVSSPVFFSGAGLTLGGEGFFNVYRGAGLYARARGSLLSGQFRNSLIEANDATTARPQVLVSVNEKSYSVVPVSEIGLGVGYRSDRLILSIGYELSNWSNLVNSPNFIDPTGLGKLGRRTSDLMLEGLEIQLGLMY